MKAVILADRYSKETIKNIIGKYRTQGIENFIICLSSLQERIEEIEQDDVNVIVVWFNGNLKSGGQLLKIANLLCPNEPFFLTYGDFLCDIDLKNFIDFHKKTAKALTMAIIRLTNKNVFGGFMLLDCDALEYIPNGNVKFENQPIIRLAEDDEIGWYLYKGKYETIYTHIQMYKL